MDHFGVDMSSVSDEVKGMALSAVAKRAGNGNSVPALFRDFERKGIPTVVAFLTVGRQELERLAVGRQDKKGIRRAFEAIGLKLDL